jgi:2-polyprenyl-3-methyl-5-hydroxy-6-metoxy-1,4-benzoquinol methylase
MSQTVEHYEKHLAPVYTWMAGGAESAFARGLAELTQIDVMNPPAGYAVDLGAGFGMHAIPLARSGYQVLAVDASAHLLEELKRHGHGMAIAAVQDDLLNFPRYLDRQPDIVLCMGDTLTHLPERAAVASLFARVWEHLSTGGRFALTFRDYSKALEGVQRFVAVRSDASRVLTCFLEYLDDIVMVHDVLHEVENGAWRMRASAYPKLRLAPDWVVAQLTGCGFNVDAGAGPSGMVRLCATRHG